MEVDFNGPMPNRCSNVGLCARVGDVERLKAQLEDGFTADVPDNRGWYCIHEAAFGNHADCMRLLVTQPSVDVNWRTHDGSTALLLAAQRGSLECLAILLHAGANPNLGSLDEMRPLIAAVKCAKRVEIIRLLLINGAEVNGAYWNGWTALHEAAYTGHVDVTNELLLRGANISVRDDEGITPVYSACQYGKTECLQLLLNSVKDPRVAANSRTNDGASCVYITAQEGYTDCLEMLLRAGADANVCTSEGIHPIVPAVRRNHCRCAKLILNHSDPKAIHYSALDPLFVAVEEKSAECFQLLLDFGLNPHRISEYYNDFSVPLYGYLQPLLVKHRITPLGMAVVRMNLDMTSKLLKHGAKPVILGNGVYSPLLLAIMKRKMPELLTTFLQFSCPLNDVTKGSNYWVPDALLVSLRPIYSLQLLSLLKSGLDPRLEFWCRCRKISGSQSRFSLLAEVSNLLCPAEMRQLVSLLLPFTTGLPNCCDDWKSALGTSSWRHFEPCATGPPCLQQLCRLRIRYGRPTSALFSEKWIDELKLPLPNPMKHYLLYRDVSV